MVRAFFTIALLVVSVAARAEPLPLHSRYDVVGSNPDGSKYRGTVNIKVISGASFTIRWNVEGAVYNGFGMRNGDALAATYMIDGVPGLVIYRADDNGTLRGLWVVRGRDHAGTEQLTPHD